MAPTSALVQALQAREEALTKESPWLSASSSLMKTPVVSTTAPLWQSAVASLMQGLMGGALQGYGKSQIQSQLNEDFTSPNSGLFKSPEYQKYLLADMLEKAEKEKEFERQKELQKEKLAADFALKGMAYNPNQPVPVTTLPGFGDAAAQIEAAKENRDFGSDKFVLGQEDETFKRLTSSQTYKDLQQIKPYYETMKSLLPIDTKAADLGVIYAFARMNDPGSTVREGEVQLSQGAAPWLQQMIYGANAELTGQGRLRPGTRSAMLDVAKVKYDNFINSYQSEAKNFGNIALERTGGRAAPSRMYPIPLSEQAAAADQQMQQQGGGNFDKLQVAGPSAAPALQTRTPPPPLPGETREQYKARVKAGL